MENKAQALLTSASIPRFDEFSPFDIWWQHKLLADLSNPEQFDFKNRGVQTIILSGGVGSAKSLMAAHLTWRHILNNPGAVAYLGRLDLPRLRESSFDVLMKHRPLNWEPKRDFKFSESTYKYKLPNKSSVTPIYWSDGDFERFKSLQMSFFHLEEGSENETRTVYDYIHQRTGRLTHIDEKLILITTNPDEPETWIYQDLIQKAGWVDGKRVEGDPAYLNYDVHVYYSYTAENPFLPPSYYEQKLREMSEQMVKRWLFGQWISIGGGGIYYQYDENIHRVNHDYVIDPTLPVDINWDFNTAKDKPMSAAISQRDRTGMEHFFDEVVMQGNTHQLMNEIVDRGILDIQCTEINIYGDAAGWARHASSNNYCDYDIIRRVLDHHITKDKRPLEYNIKVPKKNPLVKQRHNTVNMLLKNGVGEVNIKVYPKCKMLHKGFKLTKLKDSATYTEDDTKPWQHITTAAGYGLCRRILGEASIEEL